MVDENVFLLHSLFMGIFITFVYDLLRIFRRVVSHGRLLVSAEDFAFWVYCGAEVFLLMYHESNGTLRWFAVLGALAGMFFYRKIVSPLFVKYAALLLAKMLGLLKRLLKWLWKPFGFAGRKTGGAVHRAGGHIRRRMRKMCRAVKLRLTFLVKVFKMNLKA